MALQMPPQPGSTVRRIKIALGDEWQEINFGREVPRAEAIARLQVALDSFKEPTPTTDREG